ncbi:ATP-dependent DNA ligase [Streptacidiphilus rugosus]|uniref:ATP-dependent DNA ligase n=1 Tax=Streptacidiphilus rugosus TaxID=405783 RepID=UPI000A00A693|nr:hypothetical protein [Streptacidiphilus rugosus]
MGRPNPQTAPLPLLAPMLATAGPLPGADREAEYAYEPLWNGARILAHLPGNGTAMLLSAGVDVTADYPELARLPELLPHGLVTVLDGEIIAPDNRGRPSVERLQLRRSWHHPTAVAHGARDLPVRLVVYDVLHLAGPTVHLPYTARRALLDDLALIDRYVQVTSSWPAMAKEAWHFTREEGYEGIVAKRLSSLYLPGRRSRDWIKIKAPVPR